MSRFRGWEPALLALEQRQPGLRVGALAACGIEQAVELPPLHVASLREHAGKLVGVNIRQESSRFQQEASGYIGHVACREGRD